MTERRHNATAAFWLIAAFTVIMVTGLALAGTLYQRQVNNQIRNSAYDACLQRRQLQGEHNNLAHGMKAALEDFAASRRQIAQAQQPRETAVNIKIAERFQHFAAEIHLVDISGCRR